MKSIFDVVSLILFAGIALIYLQRSASSEPDPVALWKYAIAAAGCAFADIAGNNNLSIVSGVLFAATAIYAVIELKPFPRRPS